MSGKGQGLIPTSKSVEIRLQHVTQLNPRMRLRQEAEVRNYKLLKIDPRTLDERMNFFTEIQVRRAGRAVSLPPVWAAALCVSLRPCVRVRARMARASAVARRRRACDARTSVGCAHGVTGGAQVLQALRACPSVARLSVQALQLVGPSTPLSPGVGHQLSDGALSRSETVTDEIEQAAPTHHPSCLASRARMGTGARG
jgi:hypothetical protein